jgi:tetratricopeptide (TPR) repeat protein
MKTLNSFLKGQKAFLDGHFGDSIKAFSAALDEGIHPFHSHLNRGIAYLKTGDFARAIDDFDAIIEKDPIHEHALFYRGIAELNLGEHNKAIQDFDRSLLLNPDRGVAYIARGLAHHLLGHRVEEERDIHDRHALHNVELGGFMEEYIISEPLFNETLSFFTKDHAIWNLSLTEDEVLRMSTVH